MSIMDIVPTPGRGVIRIEGDCAKCGKPVPVLGMRGKGRPLDTFAPGYFCRGHAIRVDEAREALNVKPVRYDRRTVSLTKRCCGTTFIADTLDAARALHVGYHNAQYDRGAREERI